MSINPVEIELEAAPAEGGEIALTGSPWKLVGRTFAQNKLALVGLGLIVLMLLFSFIGPLIYHTNQTYGNIDFVNQPPGGSFPLGADDEGFNILGRLMVAGRPSLEVGLAVGFVSVVFGLIVGAISGYFGGWLDSLLMRIVDIGLAIPIVLLFIFMADIFKPDLLLLMGLLVLVSWLVPARIVRGEALSLRTREYVQAVKGMGGGSSRIIFKHLVPNTIGTIMVTVTFQIANSILILSILQFLGSGLPPTTPTWGGMLEGGIAFLQDGYWWQVYPALVCIVLTIVAFNLVGDALQDAFDVRLQER
jgi:peptide/nickel transport system permease protein